MSEIAQVCEILRVACDAGHPSFQDVTRTIAEKTEALDVGFFQALIELVGSDCDDSRLVFAALAIIQNYFRMQGTRRVIPPTFCARIWEVCWKRFGSANVEVRNQATSVVAMMTSQYVVCLTELGIVPRLVAVLEAGKGAGIGMLGAALDLLHQIMGAFVMGEMDEKAFLLALKLMEEVEDLDIMRLCLLLLVDTRKVGFKRIMDQEGACGAVLEKIFGLYDVDCLKIPVIEFFTAICSEYSDDIFAAVARRWLLVTVSHCQAFDAAMKRKVAPPENLELMGDVAKELLYFWESQVRVSSEAVCVELARELTGLSLSLMQNVTSSEVPDATEWEPFTAAESLIRTFAEQVPACVRDTMAQFIVENIASPHSGSRQAALKCYVIYLWRIKFQGDEFPPKCVGAVNQLTEDPDPRVRYLAMLCLEPIYSLFGLEPLVGRIDFLLSRVNDDEQIAKQAFDFLARISKNDQFPNPQVFFQKIVACVSMVPPSSAVTASIIQCFGFALVHQSFMPQCADFLATLLEQIASRCPRPDEVYSMLCSIFNVLNRYYSCSNGWCKDSPINRRLNDVTMALHSKTKVGGDVLLMVIITMTLPEFTPDVSALIDLVQTDIQELRDDLRAMRRLVCALVFIGDKCTDTDSLTRVLAVLAEIAKNSTELLVIRDCLDGFDMLLTSRPAELGKNLATYLAIATLCVNQMNHVLDDFGEEECIEAAQCLLQTIVTFSGIAATQPPSSQVRKRLFEIIRAYFAAVADHPEILLHSVANLKKVFEHVANQLKPEFSAIMSDEKNCYRGLFQRILSL